MPKAGCTSQHTGQQGLATQTFLGGRGQDQERAKIVRKCKTLLWMMKVGFFILRDEDGAVYDNIRFQPNALLKMDGAVARFIAWVNKLPLSDWSTTGVVPEKVKDEQTLVQLPSRDREVG